MTTGSNNIDIGNRGVAAESNTIRIGNQGTQTATYIAGIFGRSASGNAVVVSNTGKLGMVVSSARYKRDIQDMDSESSNLLKLRPVTFRLQAGPGKGALEYGLVAEEVAKVYPELVSYGFDGKPMTVRYLTLISMLLNELQKQNRKNELLTHEDQRQARQITKLSEQVAEMKADRDLEREQRAAFEARLSALEHTMAAKGRAPKLAAAFK